MEERAIHISSINREKRGTSRPGDFTIKFNPSLKLDPELGRYTRQHIYGEGITDVFTSVGWRLFGKTMKKAAKKGVEKAVTAAATKTGEHVGKKAGEDRKSVV